MATHNNKLRDLDVFALELALGKAVRTGSWFGLPCLKVGDKVFTAIFQDGMAFKLPEDVRLNALQVAGAMPFNPRGSGKPLHEWVLLPQSARADWSKYARLACRYIASAAEEQKTALIVGLVKARYAVLQAARRMLPEQREQVFLGIWDIKDLLAHLIGWDYTNLEAVQTIRQGEKPEFWQHFDRDWACYNAMLVDQYRQEDWVSLLSAVDASHHALVTYLDSLLPSEYVRCPKIGMLLRAESTDEKVHARQIEAFTLGNYEMKDPGD